MRIKFWGTRGSIAAPGKDTTIYGGNTTCLEITLDSGRRIVIDAGTGIRALGEEIVAGEEKSVIYLLITHIHWDHVLGFPFFAPIYKPSTKITIAGFHTCMKGLRSTFDNKTGDGFFPFKFDELNADISYDDSLSHSAMIVDDVVVDAIPLKHPQGGLGFRFRENDKSFVFITDNELRSPLRGGKEGGDYIEFCKDTDLLIHDAQYTPEENKQRRGWGHSDYVSACDLAFRAQAKKLILFHHDPSRKDTQLASIEAECKYLAKNKKPQLIVEAAKEQSEIVL